MPSWTAEQAREAISKALTDSTLPIEVLASRVDGTDVVIEFSADDRPDCRFGFRYPVHEDGDPAEVDGLGRLACSNLQEELEATDRSVPEGTPGELVWIDI